MLDSVLHLALCTSFLRALGQDIDYLIDHGALLSGLLTNRCEAHPKKAIISDLVAHERTPWYMPEKRKPKKGQASFCEQCRDGTKNLASKGLSKAQKSEQESVKSDK